MQDNNDRMMRFLEDLDVLRDRAQILQDELNSALSSKLNKNLYILSVITAIFMPLGFFSGLLGMNLRGIPGAENPLAFSIACGIALCDRPAPDIYLQAGSNGCDCAQERKRLDAQTGKTRPVFLVFLLLLLAASASMTFLVFKHADNVAIAPQQSARQQSLALQAVDEPPHASAGGEGSSGPEWQGVVGVAKQEKGGYEIAITAVDPHDGSAETDFLSGIPEAHERRHRRRYHRPFFRRRIWQAESNAGRTPFGPHADAGPATSTTFHAGIHPEDRPSLVISVLFFSGQVRKNLRLGQTVLPDAIFRMGEDKAVLLVRAFRRFVALAVGNDDASRQRMVLRPVEPCLGTSSPKCPCRAISALTTIPIASPSSGLRGRERCRSCRSRRRNGRCQTRRNADCSAPAAIFSSGRRNGCIGEPVERDIIEHIIFGDAFGHTIESAGNEFIGCGYQRSRIQEAKPTGEFSMPYRVSVVYCPFPVHRSVRCLKKKSSCSVRAFFIGIFVSRGQLGATTKLRKFQQAQRWALLV